MNKLLLSLILLVFLSSLTCAKMAGNTYIDDSYGFEVSLPANWKINTTGVKKRVLILSQDEATELGIDVFPLSAKQRDAYGVAVDQFSAYDSWENVAARHMGVFEKHGADTGFSVMYNKSVFGSSGREKKIIVQEFYLTKNGKVYIVTLLTDSEHWAEVKPALLDALNSFRIY